MPLRPAPRCLQEEVQAAVEKLTAMRKQLEEASKGACDDHARGRRFGSSATGALTGGYIAV